MKVKKSKIIIASSQDEALEGLFVRFKEAWKLAEKGKLKGAEHDLVLTLPNLSWLSKIFSPERMRVIQAIRENKPKSIYQLAKDLGRTPTNVRRDVLELADLGIIELKKTKRKGQKGKSSSLSATGTGLMSRFETEKA